VDITSFDMRWEIVGSGWAKLTWIADDDVLEVLTSYIGHGLQDLLRAAADLRLGSSAPLAWLSDEPHAHIFIFAGAAEHVYVQILVVPNENAEDPGSARSAAGTAALRWTHSSPLQRAWPKLRSTDTAKPATNRHGGTCHSRAVNWPCCIANARSRSPAYSLACLHHLRARASLGSVPSSVKAVAGAVGYGSWILTARAILR
jgi:hypothetical protein